VVCVVVAYTQEAATVRERAEVSIKEAEARATSTEREAWERVLKTEAESVASLDFVRREASELAQKVAFLEGELADARKAHDTVEANF
jgi:hypothetical protein